MDHADGIKAGGGFTVDKMGISRASMLWKRVATVTPPTKSCIALAFQRMITPQY
jgi:hypothetical protein